MTYAERIGKRIARFAALNGYTAAQVEAATLPQVADLLNITDPDRIQKIKDNAAAILAAAVSFLDSSAASFCKPESDSDPGGEEIRRELMGRIREVYPNLSIEHIESDRYYIDLGIQ